ncbi:DUF5344 family protein [Bacillus sp. CLL-7-23]|uniref:DUF5344 family protein n=1 Tax=Bacillus changyiensis TaxID=3004103 RepID=A0ABT4X586_9BACI|nr:MULTISPECIES: DUF5344 family protein [Bacillus]MDA1476427.1 DUF5344 family protein [Bacillus changyiensis]MDA7027414.1 DUF5344 family protein [Bacillus changyiensis]NPC94184.1 YwqI/YxiC family protein [Bacillus sp. WMMC1349]
MTKIKLKHGIVMKKLNTVKKAVEDLELAKKGSHGKNKLSYTTTYKSQEDSFINMLDGYKQIVQQNIKDVKGNVDLLKEQDEAIARK